MVASDWLRRAGPCSVDRGCVASADKPMTARLRLRTKTLRSASENHPIQYYLFPAQDDWALWFRSRFERRSGCDEDTFRLFSMRSPRGRFVPLTNEFSWRPSSKLLSSETSEKSSSEQVSCSSLCPELLSLTSSLCPELLSVAS
jgi:hypothetical protein